MRDRLLLPLVLLLLRALTPVGRVDALLKLNRLVDMDLEGESEKPRGWRPAGERGLRCSFIIQHHIR